MQITQIHFPSTGSRVASPQHREAARLSQEFDGLPEGTDRYDLLNLVKQAGLELGFTSKMILLLEYYTHFTKEQDWQYGSRPIVFQSVAATAMDLGVGERQIQKLEKALFDVGALTWNDTGNYKRYGYRDRETGELIEAYGVDLSPLAALQDDLEQALEQKKLYKRAWMEQKRKISWYRAQIRSMFAELSELETLPDDALEALKEYETISKPIRVYMPLETLLDLRRQHEDLFETVSSLTDVLIDDEMTPNSSPSAANPHAHIYSTTYIKSDKSDTGSHSDIALRESVPQGAEHQAGSVDAESLEPPEAVEPENDFSNITWKQVLGACSERFREHIPIDGRPLTSNDLLDAAYALLSELGVNKAAWFDACQVMGRYGAAICIMIIDQKEQDPVNPVRNPGGYLREMTARAKRGELNLHGSVFGLLKRGEDYDA